MEEGTWLRSPSLCPLSPGPRPMEPEEVNVLPNTAENCLALYRRDVGEVLEGGTDLPLDGFPEKLMATLPHVGSVCRE